MTVIALFAAQAMWAAAPPVAAQAGTLSGTDGDEPGAVELTQYTTETNQVFALPDGSFRLIAHELPVRVEQDGDWVPVDTSLVRDGGGNYAPEAISVPLTLSGGGSDQPLLQMGEDGAQVSMDWETTLPEPVVSGASLTYPEVRPGVDLVVTAEVTGYSQVLVVRDQAAAEQLRADPAQLTVEGDGLKIVKTADGGVSAIGPDAQFNGAPPIAWDSTPEGGDLGDPATPTDPGTGEVIAVNADYDQVDASTMQVEIAPPAAAITADEASYPIYVDPKMSEAGQPHTMTVRSSSHSHDYYDDPSQPLRVGYCAWAECNPYENARSFFSFDISALSVNGADPQIFDATVKAYQLWNASSSPTPVNLTQAGSFGPSTNYPGPVGAQLQQVSSDKGAGGNNAGWISFSNAAVASYVHDVAANEGGALRFSLSAPQANDKYLWKKFGNTADFNPTIDITYNFPPGTPTGLTLKDGIDCNGETLQSAIPTPVLQAQATDNNPNPLSVQHSFQVWSGPTDSDTKIRWNTNQSANTNVASGATASFGTGWPISNNTEGLADGTFHFRDQAANSPTYGTGLSSAWSTWKYFKVDTTPPPSAVITSFDYPVDQWGASSQSPGTFTLTGNSDTVGFSYSFDNDSPATITGCNYSKTGTIGFVPATGGIASLTLPTGLPQGVRHTLRVQGFDRAHNMSNTVSSYDFYLPQNLAGISQPAADTKYRYEAEDPSLLGNTGAATVSVATEVSDSGGKAAIISPAVTPSPSEPVVVTYLLPVPVTGYYSLVADFDQNQNGGQMSFKVAGTQVYDGSGNLVTFDDYAPSNGSLLPLGGFSLTQGAVGVSVVITGKNASSGGYQAVIDKFHLVPLKLTAFSSLTAAFDNRGVGVDNDTANAAKLVTLKDGTKLSLSKTALAQGGVTLGTASTQGSTVTVGSMSFTLPQIKSSGEDNAVAAGQEILVGTGGTGIPTPRYFVAGQTNPGYINLLIATTCGTFSPNAIDKSHALSVRYNDGSEDAVLDYDVMKVPDWLASAQGTQVSAPRSFSYHLSNGSTVNAQPTLYAIRWRLDPDRVGPFDRIMSVILPRVGSDLRNCDVTRQNPTMHVFALSFTNE
ncbi:MAG: hypothetical protein U0R80_10525 [Nocardioidaceae bacterium]